MAILCLCEGVSERKVQRAIDRGAASVAEIGAACRAGSGCGGCHASLQALLDARCAPVPVGAAAGSGAAVPLRFAGGMASG